MNFNALRFGVDGSSVISGTSRGVGEGIFPFSPNNNRTGVHPNSQDAEDTYVPAKEGEVE